MIYAGLLAVFGLVVGGLASALAISLRDISVWKLESYAGKNGGLEAFEPILGSPIEHSLSLAALRVLCSVGSAIGVVMMMSPFGVAVVDGDGLAVGGGSALVVDWLALVGGGVLAALLIFVSHVVVPVSMAEHGGDKLVYRLRPLIRGVHAVFLPVRLAGFVDPLIERLAGDGKTDAEEMEDELLSVVSEGERGGHVKEAEREMIEAVVQFWSTTVEEIMTPRTEIEGLELTHDLDATRDFIQTAGHSRIPVYDGSLDNIVGVLYAKDLLAFVNAEASGFELRGVVRPATFVPESKLISELLVELQSKKVHLAIVIDEYGGTTGLVTVEDLIEEIVGEIQDEHEPEDDAPPTIELDEASGSAEIEARAYIEDANDELSTIDLELPEGEDYDTVGGFVITHLGHIPVVGERIEDADRGWAITILEAEPTRVHKLRIEALDGEALSGDGGPGEGGDEGVGGGVDGDAGRAADGTSAA